MLLHATLNGFECPVKSNIKDPAVSLAQSTKKGEEEKWKFILAFISFLGGDGAVVASRDEVFDGRKVCWMKCFGFLGILVTGIDFNERIFWVFRIFKLKTQDFDKRNFYLNFLRFCLSLDNFIETYLRFNKFLNEQWSKSPTPLVVSITQKQFVHTRHHCRAHPSPFPFWSFGILCIFACSFSPFLLGVLHTSCKLQQTQSWIIAYPSMPMKFLCAIVTTLRCLFLEKSSRNSISSASASFVHRTRISISGCHSCLAWQFQGIRDWMSSEAAFEFDLSIMHVMLWLGF